MGRKCFISFKTVDEDYKKYIQDELKIEMIDKSLNEPINSVDEDYIMRKIREDYLADSTVTIHLIGQYSSEGFGWMHQRFIKRELQASLYNGEGNTRNGILGIVLPNMYDSIYKGSYECSTCGSTHSYINISDSTTVTEFNYNYYLPEPESKCCWGEGDRYCVLVKWDDFVVAPENYIEKAFKKRSDPIANKVKVRP